MASPCRCVMMPAMGRPAFEAGRPIAGIITQRHGDAMFYKYGGSDASALNLGAMPLLFWEAIQDAKENGVERFDFGRSDGDNAGWLPSKTAGLTTQGAEPLAAAEPECIRPRPVEVQSWRLDFRSH